MIGVLVGNKSDLKIDNNVSDLAKRIANEYGLEYLETSCKTGLNLENVFEILTGKILDKVHKESD